MSVEAEIIRVVVVDKKERLLIGGQNLVDLLLVVVSRVVRQHQILQARRVLAAMNGGSGLV